MRNKYKLTNKSSRIVELMDSKYNDKLIKMISKIMSHSGVSKNDVLKLLKENKIKKTKDITVINNLRSLVKKPLPIYNESYNIKKAHMKWNIYIKNNILHNHSNKISRILDYGGNVGDYARIYGNYLGLNKKDIYVVDIDEWAGEKWSPRKDITWIHFNNINEISDNSIDLITIQHTLHHIESKYFPLLISFFNRILTDNGIIVLYEHDINNQDMSTIVDLEHLLYDVSVTKKNTYGEFLNNNYMKYFKINQWKNIFSKYFVPYKIIELNNIDNSFYMFLMKKK